jgi:hypothetical protein
VRGTAAGRRFLTTLYDPTTEATMRQSIQNAKEAVTIATGVPFAFVALMVPAAIMAGAVVVTKAIDRLTR